MAEISNTERLGGLLLRVGNFEAAQFLSDFKSRLTVQKTVYLMQAFGLNLGYQYNWYLRGPYSPGLASDAYSLTKSEAPVPPVRFVNSDDEKRFLEFQQYIMKNKSDASWLEKVASIHFLRKVLNVPDRDMLFRKAKEKIPSLTKQEFDSLYAALESHKLI